MQTKKSLRRKVGLTALLLLGTFGFAGLGTFAEFTDSTTAQEQQITNGTVDIDVADPTTVTAGVTDFAPGDWAERTVTLANAGTLDLSDVTLTVTAAGSNLLTTDATNGLQVEVRECDQAWALDNVNKVYTCAGTETVVGSGAALRTDAPAVTAGSGVLTAGGTAHLVVRVDLPTTADNTFQGLGETLNYTFTATQRAGEGQGS